MNRAVETVIAKVLSPYLEGVSRENLTSGLLSGNLSLSNLEVKSSVLTQLHLHQASFERASVDSVSLTVPWMNLLTGKIVVEISGIDLRVRLYETQSLDREKLIAIKRDVIDALKSELSSPSEAPKLAGVEPESLTAKLARKLIDSLVVKIEDVRIAVLIPRKSEVDEEGFQDAPEDLSSLLAETAVYVSKISVENAPRELEIEGPVMTKRFTVSGVAITQATDVIVSNMNLELDVMHDMGNQTLETTVTGLDACNVSISDFHVATLSEVFLKGSASSSVTPVEMSSEARSSYLALYRQFKLNPETSSRFDLDQMALLFDPKAIAACELSVDRQTDVETSQQGWREWLHTPGQEQRIIEEIEASSELQPPAFVKLKVEIGNHWNIALKKDDTNIVNMRVNGAVFDLDLTNQAGAFALSGYGAFRGLELSHRDRPVLNLGMDAPMEMWVEFNEALLKVKAVSRPLRLEYQPGLIKDMQQFFKPLIEIDFSQQQRALIQSYRRLQSSPEIAQFTATMMPKSVSLELDFACPLIIIPCTASGSAGDRLVVSLGHLSFSGDQGTLDEVSLSLLSSSGSRVQILSPSPVGIKGLFDQTSQMMHLSLALEDRTVCRISPQTVKSLTRMAEFLQQETEASPAAQQGPETLESGAMTPQLSFLIDCAIKKIDLMISDGSRDLVNVLVCVPSVSLGYSLETNDMAVSVDNLGILTRCLNPSVGQWEPLLEPATLSVSGHQTCFSLRSSGISLVANPNTVAILSKLAEAFSSSEKKSSQVRLVNASRRTIYVGVHTLMEIPPSDACHSIDRLVLSSGAREILLSFNPEPESAVRLSLDAIMVSRFEDCLIHTSAKTGTILISDDAFVINQCDVPFELSLPASFASPEAEFIGATPFRGSSRISLNPMEDSLILNPGKFVSLSQTELLELQVRPLTGGHRSWYPLAGRELQLDCGGFHLRVEDILTADPVSVRHIHLRPPLVVNNHLPIPVRVKHALEHKQVLVSVPPWDSVAIYSCGAQSDAKNFKVSVGFINDSSEWSEMLGNVSEERHLISPMIGSVHPVHLTTEIANSRELTISAKWWLVDRTGLSNLVVLHADTGIPLPKGTDNVWLLPDPDLATTVEFAHGRHRWEQPLLDGGWVSGSLGPAALVLNSKETLDDKFIEIVPRFTFFNALKDEGVLVSSKFTGGAIGNAFDLVEPQSGIPLLHSKEGSFKFQFPDGSTSCNIPLKESSAGIWPLLVGPSRVCRVEISPVNGCIHVTVRSGSTIRVTNKKRGKSVSIEADSGLVFTVPPETSREIGWQDPFVNATVSTILRIEAHSEPITVPLARASDTLRYGGCVRVVAASDPQSIEIIVDAFEDASALPMRLISLDLELDRFGVSISRNGRELIYAELSLIRALLKQTQDAVRLAALVSEIQIETSVSKNNAKPVIVTNTGEGSRPFVETLVVISTTVSRGVVAVPRMQVQFDSLFVEIDSELAMAMDELLKEVVGLELGKKDTGEHLKQLLTKELVPVVRGKVQPVRAPDILILDSLFFSKLGIEIWVDFALKSMVFMPASLKLIIGVLSMGRSFKLQGAHVLIRPRAVDSFKGSADQFFQSLLQDYTGEALRNTASLLGNSSLLAIPRAPITFVSGVGSRGIETAAGAVSGVMELLSNLTADAAYREQQQRIRRSKKIAGFADGCIESANRLGEGLGGVLDIFKKPIEGARKGGMTGFVRGIGTGLLGTVIKPIAKVGEALGDIGSGIAKSVKPSNRRSDNDRMVFVRRRVPRAFYGPKKAVEDYRMVDAMLFASLPLEGMEIVVPLRHLRVLVGFSDRFVIVELSTQQQETPKKATENLSEEPTMETREEIALLEQVSFTVVDEVGLAEIAAVTAMENVGSVLVETLKGSRIELELQSSELVVPIAETMSSRDLWNWKTVKLVSEELAFRNLCSRMHEMSQEQMGARIVEVWEVERFLMAYGWVTPFMILDTGTSWRWVDEKMHKHQRIDGTLSRKDCAEFKVPPLVFGELMKPAGEWQVEVDPETTDEHGWMYAISFSSSTWQNAPGITASVRKRKWTRPLA